MNERARSAACLYIAHIEIASQFSLIVAALKLAKHEEIPERRKSVLRLS